MKKTLSFPIIVTGITVLLTLGVYLWGQQRALNPNQIIVGTTYMTMNNDFYQVVNDVIVRQLEKRGNRVYTRDPQLSVKRQCQQIKMFIDQRVNAIIINPVDSHSQKLLSCLRKAKQKGIKIIVVDTQLSDKKLADTTIVSDNYQAGVIIAHHVMADQKSANILILEHKKTVSASSRVQGFLDTLASHSDYHIVARKETKGQTEVAMPQVERVIASGLHFNVIMSLNDRVALGALAALQSHQLTSVAIYSVDGSRDLKQLLSQTTMLKGTVAQSPITMGKQASASVYSLLKGKKVPKNITIKVSWYDRNSPIEMGWQ
ncbi:substrate-binding domain-containing protein [Streptococcus sciuri]|uniref:Substrate-binding domain-containing protein n=1 Tax=Streptococcus sciuri TaxID=2973939 RepID=A0ABT2F637_9STRE|nr:substrate-binding domain-containing protein [Streptococcus sciuri]MCS4487889.1 substrate-binding domain-containing protein [Streptococcus sciuri]